MRCDHFFGLLLWRFFAGVVMNWLGDCNAAGCPLDI